MASRINQNLMPGTEDNLLEISVDTALGPVPGGEGFDEHTPRSPAVCLKSPSPESSLRGKALLAAVYHVKRAIH